jgi:hypothetical protein
MNWRRFLACLAFTSSLAPAAPEAAETLYVATLSDQQNSSADGVGGALFTVDLVTGAAKLVAPLKVGGVIPIGLTGLSIHPKTRVFYGITAGVSPAIPRSLVTIDPATGNATLVGNLGHVGSDIRFDAKGTLYVWLTDINRLGTVDLGTGAATAFEQPGYEQTLGGGIAFDRKGMLFISANTSAGTLDSWSPDDQHLVTGPRIVGAPYVSSINSMAFSDSGVLYAVNSNMGTPAKTNLVTIDPKTGQVKDIGALPGDVDPLAFAPAASAASLAPGWAALNPWLRYAIVLVIGLALGFFLARVRKPQAP